MQKKESSGIRNEPKSLPKEKENAGISLTNQTKLNQKIEEYKKPSYSKPSETPAGDDAIDDKLAKLQGLLAMAKNQ